MLNKWRVGFLALCFAVFSSLPAGARYASWQDPEYDFTGVKTVYLERFDFPRLNFPALAEIRLWKPIGGRRGRLLPK